MIVLDTDHISALQHQQSPAATRLRKRLGDYVGPCATTIVTVEEQMRGWLAVLNRTSTDQQVQSYALLQGLFSFFSAWHLLPFDEAAAQHFTALRQLGVRIGSMDLKIACIGLAAHATLLTANQRDFEKVPGLHVENWLAE